MLVSNMPRPCCSAYVPLSSYMLLWNRDFRQVFLVCTFFSTIKIKICNLQIVFFSEKEIQNVMCILVNFYLWFFNPFFGLTLPPNGLFVLRQLILTCASISQLAHLVQIFAITIGLLIKAKLTLNTHWLLSTVIAVFLQAAITSDQHSSCASLGASNSHRPNAQTRLNSGLVRWNERAQRITRPPVCYLGCVCWHLCARSPPSILFL